jgi:DNA-binding winged helix-turn-helix (wHTH) protein/tetratricopeptide (TPR) repeat protein
MDLAPSLRQVYRFGLFEADAEHSTLVRDGVRVKIQEQPFRVLLMLLERRGAIVTREELRQKLWPDGTFVDFDGSLNVILKRLRAAIDDDSENPRYIETIPRQGYRFIAPVAVREENGATAEASRAPEASAIPRESEAADAAQSKRRRRPMLVAYAATLLVMVALLVTYQFSWYRKAAESNGLSLPAQASVPVRKSVAVLGFQNVTGKPEDAWMGTAFSEMLSTELAGGGTLRLAAGEDVANLRHSSPWPQTDTLDRTTTERIGTALDSDVLVLGSYTAIGNPQRGQLRLDVRLQDAKTGEILTEASETGSTQDLFRMASVVGGMLRDKLGVPRLEAEEQASALAMLPSDPEAARLYSLGLVKFREYDYAAAQGLFEQAIKAESAFPLSHTMLARSYILLGYDEKAKAEAKEAVDLANQSKLSRVEKMEIDAAYYESVGQRDKAADIYKVLFNLFPDSLEYGLQLAKLQLASYQPDASLETIKQLRRLPPPARDDPELDMREAGAMVPRDLAVSYRLVQSAAAKAQAQGRKLAYAAAEQALCMWNQQHLQSPPECEEAYKIFLAAGNRSEAGSSLQLMAEANRLTGHDQEAVPLFEKALSMFKQVGNREQIGVTLNNLSLVLESEGQWSQAEAFYREARENFQAVNDWANTAVATGNIADIVAMRGHLSEAAPMYQKAGELIDSSGRGRDWYFRLQHGSLLLAQGQIQPARTVIDSQVKLLRAYAADPYQLANAISDRGDVEKAAGNLEGARQNYQEASDILKKINFPIASMQSSLADVSLAEGHPKAAEALLEQAIAEYEKEQSRGEEIGGYTSLSRALLAQGRTLEARDAIRQAMRFADLREFPVLELPLEILDARAIGMGAKPGGAGRADLSVAALKLRGAMEESHRLGLYMTECEARLALGEVEMKLDPAAGRAQLNELAAETHARGYDLYSRQAQQALSMASSSVAANRLNH